MEYILLAQSESSADKFIRKSVPTGRKQAGVSMYLSWCLPFVLTACVQSQHGIRLGVVQTMGGQGRSIKAARDRI